MKILYVTNHRDIAVASGGFINDYQNDLLFYGLRELYGDDVVDSTQIISLYKEWEPKINPRNLWGGMTSFWLIDENNIERTNIEEKIKDRFYDYVIYGAWRRCKEYYELVSQSYPDNKVILIDGNDETDLDIAYKKHLYFKRELVEKHPNLVPIHFAIPTCKITTNLLDKNQEYGKVIPGDSNTYIFKKEQDYYDDYNRSYYGLTMKKAGWDCMRHYEILGNHCLPYFVGLENCPSDILTNLPKGLLLQARDLADNFDEQIYFSILNEIFDYTKKYLTTKALASYVISKI